MNGAKRPWPPLIVAEHVPRRVQWRDFLLTLSMWGLFLVLLGKELELLFSDFLEQLGFGEINSAANWPVFFEALAPFLLTAAVLTGALIMFSLMTMWRRHRSLLLPQPASLSAPDEARRVGLEEAALISARDRRIVIVHIDPDGRHRIEATHRN